MCVAALICPRRVLTQTSGNVHANVDAMLLLAFTGNGRELIGIRVEVVDPSAWVEHMVDVSRLMNTIVLKPPQSVSAKCSATAH